MIAQDFIGKLYAAMAILTNEKYQQIKLSGEKEQYIKLSRRLVKKLFNSRAEIFDLNSRKNSKKILSVEVGSGHDVIRPSIYKYFTELGYEVDFLLYGKKPEDRWNFFIKMNDVKYKEMVGDEAFILSVLALPIMQEYDYIMLNSSSVYVANRIDTDWDYKSFLTYMRVPDRCKYGYLTIPPHPALYRKKDKNIQFLTHLGKCGTPMLSVSCFGDVMITPKSDKNIFLLTGNINNGQKNHEMVLMAVKKLLKQKITNFELWVNGQEMKAFNIPDELRKYVKYLGENRPETLFPILEKVDFIISGIDSHDGWQKMMYGNGTCSVGLMYAMGFGKIYICEDVFADSFGLDNTNAIIYKHDDLDEALKIAINLSAEKYLKLQKNILDEATRRYNKSLSDIRNVLELSKKVYKKRSNVWGNLSVWQQLKYIRFKICYILLPQKRKHYIKKLEAIFRE